MNSDFRTIIKILVLGLVLNTSTAHAQWALSELNMSYKYDPHAEITLYCQPIVKKDSILLFINLQINQQKPRLSDYSFDIFTADALTEKLSKPIPKLEIDSTYLPSKFGNTLLFTMPNNNHPWVIIRVYSNFSGFNFFYDYPLQAVNSPDFTIYRSNDLQLQPYANTGSAFRISKAVTVFYYDHTFNNGVPPMVTKTVLPEKALTVDSVFQWPADSAVTLKKEGLYFFQNDTSGKAGRGLRLEHKYYPRHATLTQLLEPLVYITTKEEKKKLDNITEKKEFDEFWLDLTNSPERAKKIIKEFYSRVELSNIFFTTFKEGWKTDMGMIYIIFGPPDQVVKSDQDEIWYYLDNLSIPKTKFRFIKANNVFSSSHYVLIRDQEYDNIWFRAVDLWRKSRF